MRRMIIICDKCKREVSDATLHQISNDESYDLCPGCLEVVNSWIDAKIRDWCNGKPLAEVTDKPKNPRHAGKKPVNVDWDKACALRKAGWPYAKIADELYVSPATVYRKLYLDGYYSEYLNGKRQGGNNDEGNN